MIRTLAALAPALLVGCVSTAPLELADDHPANPKASSGLIGTSTTMEGYKASSDFAARAVQEPDAPSGHAHHGHAGHGAPQQGNQAGMQHQGHGGMQHGGHAGMQHGAVSSQPAPR